MASSQRRKSDLKIDTAIVTERERKPYTMTAVARDTDRTATRITKEKETKAVPEPVKKPFCHKPGICWVCDRYGFHFDPKDPPSSLDPKKVAAKPNTSAPQATSQPSKTAAPKVKTEEPTRPPSRRLSSIKARPTSMYVGGTPVQAPFPGYAPMHHAWPVSTPTTAYPGVAFAPYPSYVVPSTPIGYMPTQQIYYEQPPVFEEPPQPPATLSRRLSTAPQERPPLIKKPSRTSTLQVVERPISRERPQIVSRDSKRSVDMDRMAMPPPPKPQPSTTVTTTRPRPGRSNTYHSNVSAHRRSVQYEYSESEDDDEEEEVHLMDPGAMITYKKPPASPRRPPSAYRRPTLEGMSDRPQLAPKSKSYHDGGKTVYVATATRERLMPRRRTTDSAPTMSAAEQKEVDAEAYMRKRGSMPLTDLTAENLKTLKNVVPRHVSDQSALGHTKGTSMSININGLNLNITDDGHGNTEAPPVKLDLGGIQISMNNRDKENIDLRPKTGHLQRAPSMSSRTPSRRSLTQGSASLVSAATSGQRREKEELLALEAEEQGREYVRRESYVDDDERQALRTLSKQSSRQASRNGSLARQPGEEMSARPKSNRPSVDYSQLRRDDGIM
ncbi:hypothetical protein LTS08_003586 [Lithohypha guttulata]|nr:hypothetical protein LTS08_003586 [Lithohypha guttulata]